MLPAEIFQRAGKILVRPQPQCKGAAVGVGVGHSLRHRSEQFEIGLGVDAGGERRAVDYRTPPPQWLTDGGLLGQDMAAMQMPVGLGPQAVAVKEWRTVAARRASSPHTSAV